MCCKAFERDGLSEEVVKGLEEMDDYTITLKHYDTPAEILSTAPALENMQLDEEEK